MFLEYDLTFNIKIYKNIALALSPLCKQFVSSSISHLPNLGFQNCHAKYYHIKFKKI